MQRKASAFLFSFFMHNSVQKGEVFVNFLEYFRLEESAQFYWLDRISEGDWRAAKYLAEVLKQNTFQKQYGPDGQIFLLTEGERLVSFCTCVPQDEILNSNLFPWIGFVYTFPSFRGHRYSQILIDHVCSCAKKQGYTKIYLSSDEHGLYEKYGFVPLPPMKTRSGNTTHVFFRKL